MRSILAITLSLGFAIFAAGCGGNACEDACEKLKSCAQAMDCAGNSVCEMTKGLYANVDCSAGNSGDCSGQAKESADKINSCSLDPKTCECK